MSDNFMDIKIQIKNCESQLRHLDNEIRKLISMVRQNEFEEKDEKLEKIFLRMRMSCNQLATQEAHIMLKEIRDELRKFES